MPGIFSKPEPPRPVFDTLLERCETNLQRHIILKQMEIAAKVTALREVAATITPSL
jgi:hypothetical protein